MARRRGVDAQERREAPRRRLRLRVRIDPGGMNVVTYDVSARGLFVRSARVYGRGTRVHLTVFLPEEEAHVDGVVRWARRVPLQLLQDVRGGMGIEVADGAPLRRCADGRPVAPDGGE